MAKQYNDTSFPTFKAELKAKKIRRLYVFFGEEVFLLQHYLQQMKKMLLDELTESFNFTRLNDENFDLQTFADAVESFPMMAENTLVQVDEVDLFKLQEEERTRIVEILADIPAHCTVVFTYQSVQWKPDKRQKKLWDMLQNHALIVQFEKQDQKDLIAWIQRHFSARNKRISPELCVYLIEITGGTMTALAGEIGKISAYSGADVICRADIDAVTEPVMDAIVYQMTDRISQGDYAGAMIKLQILLKMQEKPLSVLGAIGAHFRRLSAARTLLDHGKQSGELQKIYAPMTDLAARRTMETARRMHNKFLKTASQLVLETDYRMKTSFDDNERLLEMLILQLAQEARA